MAKKTTLQKRKWALMAYIAGDNDLSDYALSDVTEMCAEGSSSKTHVSVQIDTAGDFDGLVRYEITAPDITGKSYRTVIDRLPEKDSGSPECLESFLKFALKRYPAENRIAIVWSHGSGFKRVARDAGYDYSSNKSMDMNEIVSALSKSGINKNNKLTILGFDACLMAMIEVAHHFNEQAEILVGSQQTEPGNGWPYDKVLKRIKSTNEKRKVATGIVNEYIAYYKRSNQSDVTQSAIDLSKTDNAIVAMDALGIYLKKELNGIKTKINKVRIVSQNFEYADYIDMIDFCDKLSKSVSDVKLLKLCADTKKAFATCIIHSDKYGAAMKNASGLSVWFPGTRNMYMESRAKYKKLKCNQSKFGWLDFLDEYYL